MENRKHTSLKDLAQALGVSIPTVSRALKDSPEISRELCAKTKALAKEMNYRPNPFAMSLRKIKALICREFQNSSLFEMEIHIAL